MSPDPVRLGLADASRVFLVSRDVLLIATITGQD